MAEILKCEHLTKTIHKRKVLDDVTFTVGENEVFGILGAEGSGKTPLLRTITGIIYPDSGYISLCGYSLKREFEKAMSSVRLVFDNYCYYPNLTGYQNLMLLGDPDVRSSDIYDTAGLLGIADLLEGKLGNYTENQIQLLSMTQALMHHPKLLLLDDVFVSMTSWEVKNFNDLLTSLRLELHFSVLLTTRTYSRAELLCDRVGFLGNGKMMYIKNTVDMQKETGKIPYRFEIDNVVKAKRLLAEAYACVIVGEGRNYLDLSITKDEIPVYNHLFSQNDIAVYGIELRELSIEQTFRDMQRGREE